MYSISNESNFCNPKYVEVIILCGGIGSRLNQCIYPKPLSLVKGIPLIYRMLRHLQCNIPKDYDQLTFILNPRLTEFNFEANVRKYISYNESIMKQTKTKFWTLPFETRGALETLYLYLSTIDLASKQILILDNDNLYCTPINIPSESSGLLWTDVENDTCNHFSYINVDENNNVTDIEEKCKIIRYSKICVGYYLYDLEARLKDIKDILMSTDDTVLEYYISCLYKMMLKDHVPVSATYTKTVTLGTLTDIEHANNYLLKDDMLVKPIAVFDIDNTLIKPIVRSYRAVESIDKTVSFMKFLRSNGWYIVLNTARGMMRTSTDNRQVENVTKQQVKQDLVDANILLGREYDEIYFNKPYGDIYLDDKAFNIYDDNVLKYLGFFNYTPTSTDRVESKGSVGNVHNLMERSANIMTKHSNHSLEGEIYYYNTISRSKFSKHFPRLIGHGTSHRLKYYVETQYISGPTFSNLYLEGLLSQDLFVRLLELIEHIHSSDAIDNQLLDNNDFFELYVKKLFTRRRAVEDMITQTVDGQDVLFSLHNEIFNDVYKFINRYVGERQYTQNTVNIIHGDLWFRNIVTKGKEIYLIDMRGCVGSTLTVKGDKMYDYAKIYQSLVGLDHVLNNNDVVSISSELKNIFETRYFNILDDIKALTKYTIYCSLPSWDIQYLNRIFQLIKGI